MEVLAILFSPVIAVLVSLWLSDRWQKKNQKRRDRLEIFKTLMTVRDSNANMDFVKSVNSIDVVFHDCNEVRQAWRNLHTSYGKKPPVFREIQNGHTKLLEKMAVHLGYKDQITWEDITSSYTPYWLEEERLNQEEFKKWQMDSIRDNKNGTTSQEDDK